jgi:hypothetical protein
MDDETFSVRHGFAPTVQGIKIRQSAPDSFRSALLYLALPYPSQVDPGALRYLVCKALRTLPTPDVDPFDDCQAMVRDCPWYRVYDLVEEISDNEMLLMITFDFTKEVNRLFEEDGIGWKLENGALSENPTDRPF